MAEVFAFVHGCCYDAKFRFCENGAEELVDLKKITRLHKTKFAFGTAVENVMNRT
jgi:hypothetical protein